MPAPLNEDRTLQLIRDELEQVRISSKWTRRGPFESGTRDPEQVAASERKVAERVTEVCDDVVASLPRLGGPLLQALDAASESLLAVLEAARSYDAYASDARHRVTTVAGLSGTFSRVKVGMYMPAPTVDGMSLDDCHADRHLAALLVPVLRELGAPQQTVEALRHLAQAARELPSEIA